MVGWDGEFFLPRYIIEAQQHHVVHICQKTAGELYALQLLKARLHVPSLSPFFIQLKMGPMQLYGVVYTKCQKDQRCRSRRW